MPKKFQNCEAIRFLIMATIIAGAIVPVESKGYLFNLYVLLTF